MGLPPNDREKRKEIVAEKIVDILFRYIQHVIQSSPSSSSSSSSPSSSSSSSYQGRVSVLGVYCITYCQLIQRTDILFTDIFDRFASDVRIPSTPSSSPVSSPSSRSPPVRSSSVLPLPSAGAGIFLELLEPFILSNRLTVLPPEITQLFVQHYSEKAIAAAGGVGNADHHVTPEQSEGQKRKNNILHRVQQCILHLDIATIDFHQVNHTYARVHARNAHNIFAIVHVHGCTYHPHPDCNYILFWLCCVVVFPLQVSSLCSQYGLFSVLMYLWNEGLRDYMTPLNQLLGLLQNYLANNYKPESASHHLPANIVSTPKILRPVFCCGFFSPSQFSCFGNQPNRIAFCYSLVFCFFRPFFRLFFFVGYFRN